LTKPALERKIRKSQLPKLKEHQQLVTPTLERKIRKAQLSKLKEHQQK
jgi:hypothetical protein